MTPDREQMSIEKLSKRLDSFLKFDEGWDSYDAKKISKKAVDEAKRLLPQLIAIDEDVFIAPLSSGGLQIELRIKP